MQNVDLFDRQAIRKLQELTRNAETGFLQTHLDQIPCSGRPMVIVETDEEGRLWFFSKSSSQKNAEIMVNNRVQVICARPHFSEFLNIFGTATILRDKEKIRALWRPVLKLWLDDQDDPEVTLICVRPVEVHYWDSSHNTAGMILKNVIGALTGAALNGDIQGSLKVKETDSPYEQEQPD